MNHDSGTMTCPSDGRPTVVDLNAGPFRPFAAPALPVLIRVPAVRAPRRGPKPARRPSPTATARVRANRALPGRGRPRRRLRKGVRVAGRVLLAAATLALTVCLLRSGVAPAASTATAVLAAEPGPVRVASVTSPAIWLRIETAPVASPSMPESPVVLPGYLLPDDGIEEPDHAGR